MQEYYCHKAVDGSYHHFYFSPVEGVPVSRVVELFHSTITGKNGCIRGEPLNLLRVRLVEEVEGPYWCWEDATTKKWRMVYPAKLLLQVCFPYGLEIAEKTGQGRCIRVRVEELPLET